MKINVLLFAGFEALDAFGPVEIFSKIEDCELSFFSLAGGLVKSAQMLEVMTKGIAEIDTTGILLVPGGQGTRELVHNAAFIARLRETAEKAQFVLSVCTGAALLAKAGVLDGKKATSNKRALDWVKSTSDRVQWVEKARWVVADKFYTSSGVSAGMDMALGFVADCLGRSCAEAVARRIEYVWNDNCDKDDFARTN